MLSVLWLKINKGVTKVTISHWYVELAPANTISVRSVVILAELPNILCRMQVKCNSKSHSLFVLYWWQVCWMCRAADRRPVLSFGPIANNWQSEHTHRMVLSNVAVTTEYQRRKYMGLILAKSFILTVRHLSRYWASKYLQTLNYGPFVNI